MKTLFISSSIVCLITYLSFFQVKINTNSEETQPGTDVELTVEAKPNSYVGILGVDQSVLLLKSGNDITKVNGKTDVYFMLNHLRNILVRSHYYNSCLTRISL
jgi:hypothetical protein